MSKLEQDSLAALNAITAAVLRGETISVYRAGPAMLVAEVRRGAEVLAARTRTIRDGLEAPAVASAIIEAEAAVTRAEHNDRDTTLVRRLADVAT